MNRLRIAFCIMGICIGVLFLTVRGGMRSHADQKILNRLTDDIAIQYPDFEDADDMEKVEILREYSFHKLYFAGQKDLCTEFDRLNQMDSVQACEELYLSDDRKGHWCGGMAGALAYLYSSFGYQATTLTLYLDDISHVVTLVKCDGIWRVEDVTFNQEWVDDDGNPLDVLALVELLENGKTERVHAVNGNSTLRTMISAVPNDELSYIGYPKLEEQLINGLYYITINMDRIYYLDDEYVRRALVKRGYPADEKYFFLFPHDNVYERLR